MAQRAVATVIENVVANLLREWKLRFEDLEFWWRSETSTTFVLWLVSRHFKNLTPEDLQKAQEELQFALEAETDCNWKVIMLTPDDVKTLQEKTKQERMRMVEHLKMFSEQLGRLADGIFGGSYEWRGWLELVESLKADASHFRNRFLLYRGWDNLWVKFVRTVTELMDAIAQQLQRLREDLIAFYRQFPSPETSDFEAVMEHQKPLERAREKLQQMRELLSNAADALSREKPDAHAYRQIRKSIEALKRN